MGIHTTLADACGVCVVGGLLGDSGTPCPCAQALRLVDLPVLGHCPVWCGREEVSMGAIFEHLYLILSPSNRLQAVVLCRLILF